MVGYGAGAYILHLLNRAAGPNFWESERSNWLRGALGATADRRMPS